MCQSPGDIAVRLGAKLPSHACLTSSRRCPFLPLDMKPPRSPTRSRESKASTSNCRAVGSVAVSVLLVTITGCWVGGDIRYRDHPELANVTLASGERKVVGGARDTNGGGVHMHVGETPNDWVPQIKSARCTEPAAATEAATSLWPTFCGICSPTRTHWAAQPCARSNSGTGGPGAGGSPCATGASFRPSRYTPRRRGWPSSDSPSSILRGLPTRVRVPSWRLIAELLHRPNRSRGNPRLRAPRVGAKLRLRGSPACTPALSSFWLPREGGKYPGSGSHAGGQGGCHSLGS